MKDFNEYIFTNTIDFKMFIILIIMFAIMYFLGKFLEIGIYFRTGTSIVGTILVFLLFSHEDFKEEKENELLKELATEITGDKNSDFEIINKNEDKFLIEIEDNAYEVIIKDDKLMYSLEKDKKILKNKKGDK